MFTADGADDFSLNDDHAAVLEDAIAWCIENGANVKFYHDGAVVIHYGHHLAMGAETFLDAVEGAQLTGDRR